MPPIDRPVAVVDDDSDDLDLTTTLLRKVGGVDRLILFTSGDEVVQFLADIPANSPDFPAAIVLDVKMPGMTGLDLLSWIRADSRFNSIPVVIWSSSDDPSDVDRAAELGAQCYVGKYPPVPVVAELFEAVRGFTAARSPAEFFDVPGNLFLGRAPLQPVRARTKSGR
jgi:CheY-like chemotaxis protein